MANPVPLLIVAWQPAPSSRRNLSRSKRLRRNHAAPAVAANLAITALRNQDATGTINLAAIPELRRIKSKGFLAIEVPRGRVVVKAKKDSPEKAALTALFLAILLKEAPEVLAAIRSGQIGRVAIKSEKETPPAATAPAARRAEPARDTKPAGSTKSGAAAQSVRVPEPVRPAQPPKAAETAKPAEKFRWAAVHKIETAIATVLGLAAAATAILPLFVALPFSISIAIPIASGILSLVTGMITAIGVRLNKANFKGVGILHINEMLYSPEQRRHIIAELKAMGLGRGVYANFYAGRWEIGEGTEQMKQVEALLSAPLKALRNLTHDIQGKRTDSGNEVLFTVKYQAEEGHYTSSGWASWVPPRHETKTLLVLRGRYF